MNGTEIIQFLQNNVSTVYSAVSAVVGGVFTAVFLRHDTAMKEFEKIKAGQFKEVADDLLKSGKMTLTEYYKSKNFLDVAKKADELHAQMPKNDVFQEYDFDWFIRFYEAVGNISNQKMQDIWAKILAGEISNPSTFSLSTIDALKNMSQTDAILFEKICKYSFYDSNNAFLPRYDNYLSEADIKYSEIMQLSEIGLMYNDGLIRLDVQSLDTENVLLHYNNMILTHKAINADNCKFSVDEYPFTRVGREIGSLINVWADDDHFISFAKEVKEKNTQVEIKAHRVNCVSGNNINYQLDDLI